jgi:hypothetical protein
MALTQQLSRTKHHLWMLVSVALLLSACSGADTIDLANNKNIDDAIEAATGPLQDLNLRRQEIPEILVQAASNPYASIKKSSCAEVKTELAELDKLLGPDMEAKHITLVSGSKGLADNIDKMSDIEIPDTDTITTSLVDSASNFAHDSMVGMIQSKTNILPFRSIIRKISGANSHAKKLANAYQAGKLRRAYLKGVAEMRFGEKCLAKPIVVEAKAKTESLF